MIRKLKAPLFVQLELTERCNHGCGYCSNPFSNKRVRVQTLEETKPIIEELLENKIFSIVLTGGEPFTNRQVLHYCIDRLKNEPIEIYVNTNLSQPIKTKDIEKLKIVNYVLVSFPSSNKERFNQIVKRDSFEKVNANLEILTKEGISFGINQVVTPINYADVKETARYLKEQFDIKEFSASPVIPTCSGADKNYSIEPKKVLELASLLIRIEEKMNIKTDMLTFIPPCFFPKEMIHHRLATHGCSASRDSAIISATGEVRRCALFKEPYGNIKKEGLQHIWTKILEVEKPINEHCKECLPHEYCSGGCEARAIACGGKDPYIQGLTQERKNDLYKTPEDGKVFKLGRIMFREEGDRYIIGNGGSYVIGNEALLKFIRDIEEREFSFSDVRRDLGEAGTKLVTYLFNRGLLKECNSK